MNSKIARISNNKKLFLSNEIIEGNNYSLKTDGTLIVKELIEGENFSINENDITINELTEGYPFEVPVMDDSLVLWYEGNTGKNNDIIIKDLSDNNNDSELVNFSYDNTNDGWTHDGLKFNGVDDYVQLPELGLNPDGFTIQKNNQIVVYDGDVQKSIDSGEIKTVGRNLILSSNNINEHWITNSSIISQDREIIRGESNGMTDPSYPRIMNTSTRSINWVEGSNYTLSFEIRSDSARSISFGITETGARDPIFMSAINGDINWSKVEKTFVPQNIESQYTPVANLQFYVGKTTGDTTSWIEVKNVKLEKDSTATEWTPAPEDVLTNIDKLDEKILYDYRGKNLFKNSNHADKQAGETISLVSWGGNIQTAAYDNDVPIGLIGKSEKRVCTVAGTGGGYHGEDTIDLINGETYTLSFWAKGSEKILHGSGYFMCLNRISDNHYIKGPSVVLDTTWQRYSRTFTVASDEAGIYQRRSIIYIVSSSWTSHFKLEKGSVATPYSLAPEDVRTVQKYMLYNRAFTDDEILQNYNARNCSPLLVEGGVL